MTVTKRAFVLLSGGIDSTTCLHRAIADFAPSPEVAAHILGPDYDGSVDGGVGWVEAISVDYGQRHRKEVEYAAATCARFGIKHSVLNIRGILDGAGVMLTDAAEAIPSISYDEIKGVSPTYVPFRNGTLLSLIAAHTQKWVNAQIEARVERLDATGAFSDRAAAKEQATREFRDSAGIYFGAHAEDAANWAYPDCTPEFIGAMANAIYVGTYGCVRLYTPIQWSGKVDVIRLGESLGVDWASTWSCYAGGDAHCGVCPTCRARRAGFEAAGVADPTIYALAVA
jgi:7-cyano-7-deazaguanine synthase